MAQESGNGDGEQRAQDRKNQRELYNTERKARTAALAHLAYIVLFALVGDVNTSSFYKFPFRIGACRNFKGALHAIAVEVAVGTK